MTIQTQTASINQQAFAFAFQVAESIQADSRDYGFDFDEDELSRELLAPLPFSFANQSLPEADANAFEKTINYFLS